MYDGKSSIPTALIIASLFLASFSALAQNKINERLLASSEENQEKYFTETLQKYGMECGSVSRAFYQGRNNWGQSKNLITAGFCSDSEFHDIRRL